MKGRFTSELIELIGLDQTRALMEAHGGQYVYFPDWLSVVADDHPLLRLLGRDSLGTLIEHYGGLRILIPMGHELNLIERNAEIARDRQRGLTISQLVSKWQLSPRSIQYILAARLQPDEGSKRSRQLSLSMEDC